MAYDGSVRFVMDIDDKEAEKKLSRLEREIAKVEDQLQKSRDKKSLISEQLAEARADAEKAHEALQKLNDIKYSHGVLDDLQKELTDVDAKIEATKDNITSIKTYMASPLGSGGNMPASLELEHHQREASGADRRCHYHGKRLPAGARPDPGVVRSWHSPGHCPDRRRRCGSGHCDCGKMGHNRRRRKKCLGERKIGMAGMEGKAPHHSRNPRHDIRCRIGTGEGFPDQCKRCG